MGPAAVTWGMARLDYLLIALAVAALALALFSAAQLGALLAVA